MKLKLNDGYLKYTYFAVFFLSGFSGLIYESIWTHYLKLFLGHAAYAQALVLFIFMGGMTLGAWAAARYGKNIRNLLVAYAVVEGIVGLFSIVFHKMFVTSTDLVFLNLLPAMDWAWASDFLRWSLAALLLLPQSILLGTTFPLMSGGILRTFPKSPGKTLSILYFTNTLGAAIGILMSGFVLIKSFGLPGTLFIAGVINLSLAMVIWLLSHEDSRQVSPVKIKPVSSVHETATGGIFKILLLCSALTGMASFMYEIGWIRMLSLVLGSSTHAFELMLSAFILGLAIGGFWIRKRVETFKNPILALGWIQLVMGIMAVATLPLYGQSFELMGYFLKSITKTDQGYALFNIASHGIALAVMLPATICAGMTLPMITYILFTGGHGEPAIGKVYALNTFGGLIGIAVSVLLVMPALGLKSLIIGGAFMDILLGLYLIWYTLSAMNRNLWRGSVAVACSVLLAVTFFFHINPKDISSSVFRTGRLINKDKILYHQDGKTATVLTIKRGDTLSISTNGKPDAAISLTDTPSADELTQILTGAIPMAIHPDAKQIATIGMGSGMTSHVVLANPHVKRVDTVEIEEAMVNGARLFGDRVKRTFTDPRSSIHIDDAKAFFSSQKRTYDIIISEPSNPWVSGVSGLFTMEFYDVIKRHLANDGLFVQWMHLYEMDIELVSSVIKAVSLEFDDYVMYLLDTSNVAIIARKEGAIPRVSDSIFGFADLKDDLSRIGVINPADLMLRYMGNKKTLDDLFATFETPPNSDYYPELDQGAVKAFYLKKNALELLFVKTVPLPLLEVLEENNAADYGRPEGVSDIFFISTDYQKARALTDYLKQYGGGHKNVQQLIDQTAFRNEEVQNIRLLKSIEYQCDERGIRVGWLPGMHWLAKTTLPYTPAGELHSFWQYLESTDCYSHIPPDVLNWIQLYRAIDERNYPGMMRISESLLSPENKISRNDKTYLVAASVLGSIALDKREEGLSVLKKYMGELPPEPLLMLLATHLSVPEKRTDLYQQAYRR